MKIAIAKIVPRHLCKTSTYSEKERVDMINQLEIDDAKEWCRKSIELRAEMDKLNVNLDDIKYSVKEIFDEKAKWYPQFAYKVTAELYL